MFICYTNHFAVVLVNFRNTLFPDNPCVNWDTILLSEKIAEHVEQLEIDTVFTFDSYGVSGHRNHVSIYSALFHLVYNKLLPECKLLINLYIIRCANLEAALNKFINCL